MHWRRKWQPTPVFLPGESQGWGSLVGCCLWGRTELDTTDVTAAAAAALTVRGCRAQAGMQQPGDMTLSLLLVLSVCLGGGENQKGGDAGSGASRLTLTVCDCHVSSLFCSPVAGPPPEGECPTFSFAPVPDLLPNRREAEAD